MNWKNEEEDEVRWCKEGKMKGKNLKKDKENDVKEK